MATIHPAPARRAPAALIRLAAAPTFALMAILSASAGAETMICASSAAILPVDGMVWMYLLMSLFHLPPWLTITPVPPPEKSEKETTNAPPRRIA